MKITVVLDKQGGAGIRSEQSPKVKSLYNIVENFGSLPNTHWMGESSTEFLSMVRLCVIGQ